MQSFRLLNKGIFLNKNAKNIIILPFKSYNSDKELSYNLDQMKSFEGIVIQIILSIESFFYLKWLSKYWLKTAKKNHNWYAFQGKSL